MLQTRKISWIGYVKRVCKTKENDCETKVMEIPFKLEGNKTKYLLRIKKIKNGKNCDFHYEIFEIAHEYMGMIETFRQENSINETSVVMDLVLNHKKVRRELRWIKGWF